MPSVNITTPDRDAIKRNIRNHFTTVAKSKNKRSDFHAKISKKIVEKALYSLEGVVENNPLKELLPVTKAIYLKNSVYRVNFPANVVVKNLSDSAYGYALLHDSDRLFDFSDDDNENTIKIDIPYSVIDDQGQTVNILHENYIAKFIDEEIRQEIEDHNTWMTDTFSGLEEQIKVIMEVVSECRTTKQFEEKIPSLVSFYTPTVKRKLREKEEELAAEKETEQDDVLKAAISSIATGKLLSSQQK